MIKIIWLIKICLISYIHAGCFDKDEEIEKKVLFGEVFMYKSAKTITLGSENTHTLIPYSLQRSGMIVVDKPEIKDNVVMLHNKEDGFDRRFQIIPGINKMGLNNGMKFGDNEIEFTEKQMYLVTINYKIEHCFKTNLKFLKIDKNLKGKDVSVTEMIIVEANDVGKIEIKCIDKDDKEENGYNGSEGNKKFNLKFLKISLLLI